MSEETIGDQQIESCNTKDDNSLRKNFQDSALCRICLEDPHEHDLISVCKCAGSVEFVHESCIKLWILSNSKDIREAKCELCKANLLIDYKEELCCSCENTFNDGLEDFAFAVGLLIVLVLLVVIEFMVISEFSEYSFFQKIYNSILFAASAIGGVIVMIAAVHFFKKSLVKTKITRWRVLSRATDN